jgi:hypothetical protein
MGYYRLGSSIPSLCTFLPTLFSQTIQQASLKIAILTIVREGSLEFTQFFNHSHLWKLQRFTAGCSTIELLRKNPSHEGTDKVPNQR